MATRKQKHEQALAKRAKFLEDVKRSGQKAQELERGRLEHRARENQRNNHDQKHSWKKIDKNCLHCQDLLAAQARQRRELEEAAVSG